MAALPGNWSQDDIATAKQGGKGFLEDSPDKGTEADTQKPDSRVSLAGTAETTHIDTSLYDQTRRASLVDILQTATQADPSPQRRGKRVSLADIPQTTQVDILAYKQNRKVSLAENAFTATSVDTSTHKKCKKRSYADVSKIAALVDNSLKRSNPTRKRKRKATLAALLEKEAHVDSPTYQESEKGSLADTSETTLVDASRHKQIRKRSLINLSKTVSPVDTYLTNKTAPTQEPRRKPSLAALPEKEAHVDTSAHHQSGEVSIADTSETAMEVGSFTDRQHRKRSMAEVSETATLADTNLENENATTLKRNRKSSLAALPEKETQVDITRNQQSGNVPLADISQRTAQIDTSTDKQLREAFLVEFPERASPVDTNLVKQSAPIEKRSRKPSLSALPEEGAQFNASINLQSEKVSPADTSERATEADTSTHKQRRKVSLAVSLEKAKEGDTSQTQIRVESLPDMLVKDTQDDTAKQIRRKASLPDIPERTAQVQALTRKPSRNVSLPDVSKSLKRNRTVSLSLVPESSAQVDVHSRTTTKLVRDKFPVETVKSLKDDSSFPEELLLGHGKFQWMILVCAHLSAVVYMFHHLSIRLLAPPVNHWCKQPVFSFLSREQWLNWSIPLDEYGRRSHCTVYDPTTPPASPNASRAVRACTEWDYDLQGGTKTIVSQWDLVCEKAWYVRLSTFYYIIGSFMFVPLLAQASDKLGRKHVVNICVIGALCSGFTILFASTFIVFVIARMFLAACVSTLRINTFILLFEVTAIQYRDYYCCIAHFGVVIGSAVVSVLETLVLDRRVIVIVGMMPTTMLVLSFYAVEDSPRWLVGSWNIGGARKVVLWAAQLNKVNIDFHALQQYLSRKKSEIPESFIITIEDIFVHSALRGRTFILCSIWFCVLFSVYGMHATSPKATDIVTSLMGTVLPRTVSVMLSCLLLKTCNRKASLGILLPLTSALACVLSVSVASDEIGDVKVLHELTLSSAMLSAFLVYNYTMEMFPTVIRAVGVSAAFFCGRIGVAVSPFLGNLAEKTYPSVPPLLIACLLISAMVLLQWLPETKETKPPDTMRDLESEAMKDLMMRIVHNSNVFGY